MRCHTVNFFYDNSKKPKKIYFLLYSDVATKIYKKDSKMSVLSFRVSLIQSNTVVQLLEAKILRLTGLVLIGKRNNYSNLQIHPREAAMHT